MSCPGILLSCLNEAWSGYCNTRNRLWLRFIHEYFMVCQLYYYSIIYIVNLLMLL